MLVDEVKLRVEDGESLMDGVTLMVRLDMGVTDGVGVGTGPDTGNHPSSFGLRAKGTICGHPSLQVVSEMSKREHAPPDVLPGDPAFLSTQKDTSMSGSPVPSSRLEHWISQ
jgi:hypothetical protein